MDSFEIYTLYTSETLDFVDGRWSWMECVPTSLGRSTTALTEPTYDGPDFAVRAINLPRPRPLRGPPFAGTKALGGRPRFLRNGRYANIPDTIPIRID